MSWVTRETPAEAFARAAEPVKNSPVPILHKKKANAVELLGSTSVKPSSVCWPTNPKGDPPVPVRPMLEKSMVTGASTAAIVGAIRGGIIYIP